jgi:hypothetical protein
MDEKKEEVNKYLKERAKELHKPVKRNFPRRKIFVRGKDDTWAMDLVDMKNYAKDNENFKYMLTIVDLWTKYAWAVPVKDKTGPMIMNAFKRVVTDSGRKPKKIYVDKGGEFYNGYFDKYLHDNGIQRYSTFAEFKASPVERFNRTLKSRMWRKFSELQTRNWVDILPELMDEYNTSKHQTIGTTPALLSNYTPEGNERLRKRLYGHESIKRQKPKFKLGQWVRVSKQKGKLEKSYTPAWSDEIYKIVMIAHTDPIVYGVEDRQGERIQGSFYEPELQATKQGDIFLVDEVLKERTVDGHKQYFVSWVGAPKKFNQWITEADLLGI